MCRKRSLFPESKISWRHKNSLDLHHLNLRLKSISMVLRVLEVMLVQKLLEIIILSFIGRQTQDMQFSSPIKAEAHGARIGIELAIRSGNTPLIIGASITTSPELGTS